MISHLPFAPALRGHQRIGPLWGWIEDHEMLLLQIGVVLGVMMASLVVGWRPRRLFLYPLPALAGALILIRRPSLGLPLLVVSTIVPIQLGTGTGSSFNASMLLVGALVGLWVMGLIIRQRDLHDLHWETAVPALVFVLVSIVAFIAGQLSWFRFGEAASIAAQTGGLILFVLSALGYIWVGHEVRDLRWLQAAVWLLLAIGAVYITGRLLGSWPITRHFPRGLVVGSLFWVWLVALALSQMLFNKRLPVPARAGLGLLVAATLYVAIGHSHDWKSGWVPAVAVVALLIAFYVPRFSLLMALLSLVPALEIVNDVIATDAYSYYTRLEAWEIVLEMIEVNPLLGVGPANYYFYTPLFPIRGYYVSFNSHNQYVDFLAQIGIAGVIVYIWFLAKVWQLGWQLLNRVPEGFAQAYVFGALAGLVGMVIAGMLGDWVVPFVYNVGFSGFRSSMLGWLFLGGLPILAHLYPAASEEEGTAAGTVPST